MEELDGTWTFLFQLDSYQTLLQKQKEKKVFSVILYLTPEYPALQKKVFAFLQL